MVKADTVGEWLNEVVRGFKKTTRTGEDPRRASEIAAQRERPEFCSDIH